MQFYFAAQRNGWLAELKAAAGLAKKPAAASKWTQEACLARAKDFASRYDWQSKAGDGSYITARKKGWLNDIANEIYGKRRSRWHPSI